MRQTGKQYHCVTLKEGVLLQDRAAQGIVMLGPEKEDVFPQDPLDCMGQADICGWTLYGDCESLQKGCPAVESGVCTLPPIGSLLVIRDLARFQTLNLLWFPYPGLWVISDHQDS